MSVSRGLGLLQRVNYTLRKPSVNFQQTRNSGGRGFSYRTGPYPFTKFQIYGSEFFMSLMWWWVFYNLWHDHGHLFGEFEYPDPSKWTDEELGIPPDDE